MSLKFLHSAKNPSDEDLIIRLNVFIVYVIDVS